MASKNHLIPVGSFAVLLSGRVVQVTNHRSRAVTDVNFASAKGQPWYDGIDAGGVQHSFPQSSVVGLAHGFPHPVLPAATPEPSIPRVIAKRRSSPPKRVSKELTVSWPMYEDASSATDYATQASRIVDFLVEELPAGITDKVLLKWIDYMEATPDGLLPTPIIKALRRLGRKLTA